MVGNKEVDGSGDGKVCRRWFILEVRNVRDNGDEVSKVDVLS
jgi:hypothetical protein